MATLDKKIKVARLFPNIQYLHGDRGNAIALQRVAGDKLDVEITDISFKTENFNPDEYDILLCPPGEISSFETLIEWLRPYKEALKKYIDDGKVFVATGTGQCLFGESIEKLDGTIIEGLGIADFKSVERPAAYGDDIYFKTTFGGEEMECFGIQVQMQNIISNEEPFGYLLYGYGNTGKDRKEGAMIKNAIFTNAFGPLLVLNPWLSEKILLVAAKNAGIEIDTLGFDMELEKKSMATKIDFVKTKATNLTNCK